MSTDTPMSLVIAVDDPRADDVQALIARHLAFAHAQDTPPEGRFALALDGLVDTAITFFTARRGGELVAMGALRELDTSHGEVKSMHTITEARGQRIGRAMLEHLIDEARRRGYERVSLETGSMDAFIPARSLYADAGFAPCGPFGDYPEAAWSTFMTLRLR